MLHGLDVKNLSKKHQKVKIRVFPGAKVGDMRDYLNPLLKKDYKLSFYIFRKKRI